MLDNNYFDDPGTSHEQTRSSVVDFFADAEQSNTIIVDVSLAAVLCAELVTVYKFHHLKSFGN